MSTLTINYVEGLWYFWFWVYCLLFHVFV